MDLLRFTTAGSVDDGKSTLIGRLLYDSKSIFEDQLDAVERTSKASGEEKVNLALLTDGLRAEREQKITIDVAYRYFATPRRKFIIADTPGHTQYTRNMVTGASTADLAIILIDASKGVLTQSRRHAFISSLLRIPHLVLAVNKMDLVGYSEERFREILDEFNEFAKKLDVQEVTAIPISALEGDNVVEKSVQMPWYKGATLLYHLETVNVKLSDNLLDFRLPVQYVIRPNQQFRGFSGQIVSGRIKPGDEISVLPRGTVSRVKEIVTADGLLEEAFAGDSVVLRLEDEIDVSRGDMIVRRQNVPTVRNEIESYVCWMHETPLRKGQRLKLMHTSRLVTAVVDEIFYKIDVDTLQSESCNQLALNEIARVKLSTTEPLFFDPYKVNKKTGGFILIDPASLVTVAAGMIRAGSTTAKELDSTKTPSSAIEPSAIEPAATQPSSSPSSENVVWEPWNIPLNQRESRNGHKAVILWLTGISGAGKSTIARALEHKLWSMGVHTMLLDGDQLRHGLNADLGFSDGDRSENIRRVGEVARLFYEHGNVVICTFVSPFRRDREAVASLVPEGRFLEVHVECSGETAQTRDPKGLYAKAAKGELKGLTGYDGEYQAPESPFMTLNTDQMTVEEAVAALLGEVETRIRG